MWWWNYLTILKCFSSFNNEISRIVVDGIPSSSPIIDQNVHQLSHINYQSIIITIISIIILIIILHHHHIIIIIIIIKQQPPHHLWLVSVSKLLFLPLINHWLCRQYHRSLHQPDLTFHIYPSIKRLWWRLQAILFCWVIFFGSKILAFYFFLGQVSHEVNRPANRVRKKNQVSFVAVVKWKYCLNHEWHINSSYWYHFKIQQSGSLHMCVCMIFIINNNDIAFINCNRIV